MITLAILQCATGCRRASRRRPRAGGAIRTASRLAGVLMLVARPNASKVLTTHQPGSIWPGNSPIRAERGNAW